MEKKYTVEDLREKIIADYESFKDEVETGYNAAWCFAHANELAIANCLYDFATDNVIAAYVDEEVEADIIETLMETDNVVKEISNELQFIDYDVTPNINTYDGINDLMKATANELIEQDKVILENDKKLKARDKKLKAREDMERD